MNRARVTGQSVQKSVEPVENEALAQSDHEGREEMFLDIDRMVNEGLGGGTVTDQNGWIGDTTVDTMDDPE